MKEAVEKALIYQTYAQRGGETFLHPILVAAVLIAGFLIIFQKRRNAMIPILFISILTPLSQRVVVAGFDLMIIRILILIGWLRVLLHGEQRLIRLNTTDKVFILWVIFSIFNYTLLWQTVGAFVNRLGFAVNAIGIYFLARIFITDLGGIVRMIKVLVIVSCVLAFFMLVEQATGRNILSMFGGVPEFSLVRNGHVRAQGPFSVSITAGTFGATLFPLFVSLWWHGDKNKIFALLGAISASIVTFTSASSGPVITYLAGIVGLCFWPLRNNMRAVRRIAFFLLIGLHLAMKAPVWALIQRVSMVAGSSGYHRYMLVDHFISNISEWWLWGIKSTYHWGYQMFDTVNQFVLEGIRGGLMKLILFISLITLSFKTIGSKMESINDKKMQFCMWAFGSALFAHLVAFLGITYFDQIFVIWYLLLAMISTMSNLSEKDFREEVHDVRQNIRPVFSFGQQQSVQ
jgi:hypothetical protein